MTKSHLKRRIAHSFTTVCAAAFIVSSFGASNALAQSRGVQIGLDGPNYDACGSTGQVYNLNPNGDNYLSVRSRPSSNGRELDRLGPNQWVRMCEESGGWHGVVYSKSDEDCGVSSPVSPQRTYSGNCKSGWVFGKYIKLIAG